ncbi:hypothetical protein GCM10010358_66360 [Streptomyces minutiscleroticus]|uniref:Uncharacterized protein n=1 Tax=Streptomyces minutiscleroticus TaxID=68238 RepID=A0A918U769_9ACTN|nr:hypothetical protein GCM10010358_66360 [Streptomyces minutiscleroticus]
MDPRRLTRPGPAGARARRAARRPGGRDRAPGRVPGAEGSKKPYLFGEERDNTHTSARGASA